VYIPQPPVCSHRAVPTRRLPSVDSLSRPLLHEPEPRFLPRITFRHLPTPSQAFRMMYPQPQVNGLATAPSVRQLFLGAIIQIMSKIIQTILLMGWKGVHTDAKPQLLSRPL
jgi:hypothetical protein